MKATIRDIIKSHPDMDWEIYEGDHFHTDYCSWVDPDEVDLDNEMDLDWEVFNQEEYNNTILANSCESANFDDWYGDENAKVLCILIKA